MSRSENNYVPAPPLLGELARKKLLPRDVPALPPVGEPFIDYAPVQYRQSPLDDLASILRRLTFGDMMTFAEGIDNLNKVHECANRVHEWAKSYSGETDD